MFHDVPFKNPSIGILLALAALAGCYDFERLVTDIRWSPAEASFQIEIQAQNLSGDFFDCEEDARACSVRIREAMRTGDLLDIVDKGCDQQSEKLVARDGQLDLVVTCRSLESSLLPHAFGVSVEEEGKTGKEKKHLVVHDTDYGSPADLPKSTRHRVRWTMDDDGEVSQVESWSLKPSVKRLKMSEEMDDDIEPVLQAYPGLEKFLKKDRLI